MHNASKVPKRCTNESINDDLIRSGSNYDARKTKLEFNRFRCFFSRFIILQQQKN